MEGLELIEDSFINIYLFKEPHGDRIITSIHPTRIDADAQDLRYRVECISLKEFSLCRRIAAKLLFKVHDEELSCCAKEFETQTLEAYIEEFREWMEEN